MMTNETKGGRIRGITGILAALVFCAPLVGYAQTSPVPDRVAFQGVLKVATGPVTGIYNLTFKIFDAPSAGVQLWTETQTGVSVTGGRFSVALGAVNPIPFSVANTSGTHLQVEVGAEVLGPRQALNSSLYAFRAQKLGVIVPDTELFVQGAPQVGYHLRVSSQNGTGSLLVVSSNGAVGIGTATPNPSIRLSIDGITHISANADNLLALINKTGTAGAPGAVRALIMPQAGATQQEVVGMDGKLILQTGGIPGAVSAAPRLTILGNGNIGIGTTTPESTASNPARVDISSAGSPTGLFVGPTTDHPGFISIRGGTSGSHWQLRKGLSGESNRLGLIYFSNPSTSSGEMLTVLPSGNVGINNPNPAYNLEVLPPTTPANGMLTVGSNHGSLASKMYLQAVQSNGYKEQQIIYEERFAFFEGGAITMAMDTNNRVGIGNYGASGASPVTRFEIAQMDNGGDTPNAASGLNLKKIANQPGSLRLFVAITSGNTGSAACNAAQTNATCLAAYAGGGAPSTCGTSGSGDRVLCVGYGD